MYLSLKYISQGFPNLPVLFIVYSRNYNDLKLYFFTTSLHFSKSTFFFTLQISDWFKTGFQSKVGSDSSGGHRCELQVFSFIEFYKTIICWITQENIKVKSSRMSTQNLLRLSLPSSWLSTSSSPGRPSLWCSSCSMDSTGGTTLSTHKTPLLLSLHVTMSCWNAGQRPRECSFVWWTV